MLVHIHMIILVISLGFEGETFGIPGLINMHFRLQTLKLLVKFVNISNINLLHGQLKKKKMIAV